MAGILSTYYLEGRGTGQGWEGKVREEGAAEKALASCDCGQVAPPMLALVNGPGHVCAATQGCVRDKRHQAPHLVRLLSSPTPALGVGGEGGMGKGEDGSSGGQARAQVRGKWLCI